MLRPLRGKGSCGFIGSSTRFNLETLPQPFANDDLFPISPAWFTERCEMPKAKTITFVLAAATILATHNHSALAETEPCRAMEYERNPYTICEVDLLKHMIRLYWKKPDGTAYAYLSALPQAVEREAGRMLFATNAGMFDSALKPVGLYVEQGRELVHVNTTSGYGNFHMKPNGVFYVSVDRAAVVEKRRRFAREQFLGRR
jgi:uncharacterized protein YigE (DUF2233 family)